MKCARCGSEFDNANFCPECGLPAPKRTNPDSHSSEKLNDGYTGEIYSNSHNEQKFQDTNFKSDSLDQTRIYNKEDIYSNSERANNQNVNSSQSKQPYVNQNTMGYGDNFDAIEPDDKMANNYNAGNQYKQQQKPPAKKNTGLIAALIVACVIIAVFIAIFAFSCGEKEGSLIPTMPTQVTQPTEAFEEETQAQESEPEVIITNPPVPEPDPTAPPEPEPTPTEPPAPEPTNPPEPEPTDPPAPEPIPTDSPDVESQGELIV